MLSSEFLPEKNATHPEDVKLTLTQTLPQKSPLLPACTNNSRVPLDENSLDQRREKVALAKANLVELFVKAKKTAKKRGRSTVEGGKDFLDYYNTGVPYPNIYKTLGRKSFRTLERWRKIYSSCKDYTCLADRYGGRKGKSKVTDDEFNTVLSFALHPNKLRISQAVRFAKMALEKRGIPSPSSPTTLRNAVFDWRDENYDKWVFCREGAKALNDKVLPYIERDAGLLDVGDVLIADGHKLNFQILHPFTGKPVRMSLVIFYDWASRMPVGIEIMPTENIQCVAAALRRAILTLGKIPRAVYLDNGAAFKAKIFTDTDIDFEEIFYGMFARLAIVVFFALPYNAPAKIVERFFGTFNELERLMPTYRGASIQDKPAHKLRNERLHKKAHEIRYGGWAPTIEEAIQIISWWFDEYSRRPHEGLKGLCPKDVFEAGRGPGVDEKALRYLMMNMDVKRVYRNGIKFMGRSYYAEELYGYRKPVLIRYDLEDLSEILIYTQDGKKELCTAKPIQPVHPVARLTGQKEDLQIVRAGIKQKRRLKKETERFTRAYVTGMPELVSIPETVETEKIEQVIRLPRAEAEKIEAEAAKMKVLEFKPRETTTWVSDADHYEALLEQECSGESFPLEEMEFMRAFEKTQAYRDLKERFEFLKEYYLAGPETEENQ